MLPKIKHDNPDACISCNICLTACPVAKATRLYRGPKLNGPALTRLRKLVTDDDPMVQFCSNCKNCDRVCPSGTSISAFNMKARADFFKRHPKEHDMGDMILCNNEILGKAMTAIPFISAPAANIGMKVAAITKMLPKFGVATYAPLPSYSVASFYTRFKLIKQPSCQTKVLFFPGCYVNYNESELGLCLIDVLNRNNVEVIVDPRLNCCGSPILSTGYLDKVEKHAQNNAAILKEYADKGIDIITTCTTCSLFLKQEYDELFNLPEVKSYAPRVYEAMEYLMMRNSKGFLVKSLAPLAKRVAYHTPCHLKVQGMGRPTLDMLKFIPALEVEDLNAGCRGLSGVYGYKKNTAPIGHLIGSNLRSKISESKATLSICECNICRLQMQNGTNKKAVHPLYLLRESYKKRAGH